MQKNSWMKDVIPNDAALRSICFPATHDSGTYALTDRLAPEPLPRWIQASLNLTGQIESALFPFLKFFRSALSVRDWLIDGIREQAVAVERTISQQLEDGIRCLDLRVAYDNDLIGGDNSYKIHHGLFGPSLQDVLQQCRSFLSAHPGEILYITLGHWIPDTPDVMVGACALVNEILGEFAFGRNCDGDDLFSQEYQSITASGTLAKCILVTAGDISKLPEEWRSRFWPEKYNPPSYDDNGGPSLWGAYTETSDRATMLSCQLQKLQDALPFQYPFALYLTLTESQNEAIAATVECVVASAVNSVFLPTDVLDEISGAVRKTTGWIPVVGDFYRDEVDKRVREFTADIREQIRRAIFAAVSNIVPQAPSYSSLKELTSGLFELREQFYRPGSINIVYMDFYNTTSSDHVDDWPGIVRWAVSLTITATTQAALVDVSKRYYLVNQWRAEQQERRAGMVIAFTGNEVQLYPQNRPDQWMPVELSTAPSQLDWGWKYFTPSPLYYLINQWRANEPEPRAGMVVAFTHTKVQLYPSDQPDQWMPVKFIPVKDKPNQYYLVNQWCNDSEPRYGMALAFDGIDIVLYPKDQAEQWMPVELIEVGSPGVIDTPILDL